MLFLCYFVFFGTTSDSHRTLHSALDLVGMHFAAASMWAVMKFSYLSFGVCVSNISWRVSNFFLTVTVYLLWGAVVKCDLLWGAVVKCDFR